MIDQNALKKFNDIYNLTYDRVLKYIICKCSNFNDVNDIIQETYLDIYKAIIGNKSIINMESYIIGIAKNKLRKYYRLSYRFKTISLFHKNDDLEILDTIKSDIDLEKNIVNKNDINRIWEFLRCKKVNIIKIFYFYYVLDFTLKEISLELNLTESCIKSSLYRTLKEMQELLKKEDV